MKCKVCGRELNPNKNYCEKCGTPIKESISVDGEFSWNTIDFPKPKKMQDIKMQWPDMNKPADRGTYMTKDASEGFVAKAGKENPQPEPIKQNVQQEPAPMQQASVQYASPQMTWTMPSTQWVVQQPVQTVQPVYVTQPMPAVTTTMQMPQLNLNPLQNTVSIPVTQIAPMQAPVQSVPLQANVQTAPMPNVTPEMMQRTMPTNPDVPYAAAGIKNPIDVDNWLDEQLKDSKPSEEKFFTFYKKNEDFQKLLDEEYENYKKKFDTNATSLQINADEIIAAAHEAKEEKVEKERTNEDRKFDTVQIPVIKETIPKEAPAEERTVVYTGKPEHAFPVKEEELSQPSEDIFTKEPVTDFDKMIYDGTKDKDEVGEATLVITNEELKKEIDEVSRKVDAACDYLEYDAEKRQKDLDDMAAARAAFLNRDTKADLDKTSAIEIKSIFDEWDKQRKEAEENKKKEKKKGGFGRFLLILILLIALFVGADCAAITFLADSPIREFFFNVNTKAEEVYNEAITKFNSLDFLNKKENEDEKAPEVELTSQEKLVKEVNTNIKSVTCDVESAKYSKDGKYGYNNLGATTVETSEEVINAVTETLVKYNCAWIDYVNSGSDIACFDYLKADGEAFRLASSFDSVGKIKEEFKSLNIGEVRKDSKNVYVFADEDILVKNGNGTTEVPSRLVYRLEKVGDVYKIVDYDNYGSK